MTFREFFSLNILDWDMGLTIIGGTLTWTVYMIANRKKQIPL